MHAKDGGGIDNNPYRYNYYSSPINKMSVGSSGLHSYNDYRSPVAMEKLAA